MQITTLSTQLGLGSELVDWYRDATSVPFGHLLIDLSPRTDDRLRYCTTTGFTSSNFYIPDRLKQSNILDDEHTKSLSLSLSLQVFQPFSHKCKNLFLQSCPKDVVRFLCDCIINLLKGNLQSIKKTSRGKISERGSTIVSKMYNLEAKKRHSGLRKRLTAH